MDKTTIDMLSADEREKIYTFLKAHPVAVLATVDQTNGPHASVIYIGVNDKLNISFTTKSDTQKNQNILRNNTVMLVAYDKHDQAVVQIHGKAIRATDTDTQQQAYYKSLHAAEQTGPDNVPPLAKIAAGELVAYEVEIDDIWLSEYGHGGAYNKALRHIRDTENHFEDPA